MKQLVAFSLILCLGLFCFVGCNRPAAPQREKKPPVATPGATVKPAETKAGETKATETKPAETKAPEAKPTETKPAETKAPEAKPAETKPAETKPGDKK